MQIKMFRERNPMPLGLIVIVWLVVSLLVVLNLNALIDQYGRQYKVILPEAAGLVQGAPVRVSGLHVGRVGTVKLGEKGVEVEFSLTNAEIELGDQTTAEVSVETVLGDKALQLHPAGEGALAEGATIPIERTSVPYDVTDALTDLQQTTERIDTDEVAHALTTLSDTLEASAPELRGALEGVSRISATINSRDETLRSLLDNAEQFSGILADRSDDLTTLIKDGNVLFAELLKRRDDISSLLANVSAVSQQLSGLVKDNQKEIGPALDQLNTVIKTLKANKHNISETLRGMAVYATGLGEVVASGQFFSAYLQNLLPGNLLPPKIDLGALDLGGLLGTGTKSGGR